MTSKSEWQEMPSFTNNAKAGKWIVSLALCALTWSAGAQDFGWLLDQAPLVSRIIVRATEKAVPFSASVELSVSGTADPVPSAAVGRIDSQNGNLRWEVRLADINSPQLTISARTAIRQINGERFLLLTRPDEKSNYLILPGAHAYLDQPLADVKIVATKPVLGTEIIDGRVCAKERRTVLTADGHSVEVLLWRAKELKNVPVQVQVTLSGEEIRIRFRQVQLHGLSSDLFKLPPGLSKYKTIEDLVQSVVLDKMKRRMGLQ